MSKFSEQFTARYKDTETLRRKTKEYRDEVLSSDVPKKKGQEPAKPTRSKLGKRL